MFIVNGLWPDRETLLSVACPSSLLHIRLVLIRVMLYRCITVFDCILIIKYMGIGGQQKDDYFVFVHFSSRLAAAAAAAAEGKMTSSNAITDENLSKEMVH